MHGKDASDRGKATGNNQLTQQKDKGWRNWNTSVMTATMNMIKGTVTAETTMTTTTTLAVAVSIEG